MIDFITHKRTFTKMIRVVAEGRAIRGKMSRKKTRLLLNFEISSSPGLMQILYIIFLCLNLVNPLYLLENQDKTCVLCKVSLFVYIFDNFFIYLIILFIHVFCCYYIISFKWTGSIFIKNCGSNYISWVDRIGH